MIIISSSRCVKYKFNQGCFLFNSINLLSYLLLSMIKYIVVIFTVLRSYLNFFLFFFFPTLS